MNADVRIKVDGFIILEHIFESDNGEHQPQNCRQCAKNFLHLTPTTLLPTSWWALAAADYAILGINKQAMRLINN